MPELIRFIIVLVIAVFILFSLVQCRAVFPESMDRQKQSVETMCMFRKSRFCDYLRSLQTYKDDQNRDDQDLWKRGVSHFYSNW